MSREKKKGRLTSDWKIDVRNADGKRETVSSRWTERDMKHDELVFTFQFFQFNGKERIAGKFVVNFFPYINISLYQHMPSFVLK